MSKGLSKQQQKILAVLRTKQDPRDSTRGAFTTDEVISELSFDYRMWLVSDGPVFGSGPRSREALRPYESLRISIHRALQSLERRGLIVSYLGKSSWRGVLAFGVYQRGYPSGKNDTLPIILLLRHINSGVSHGNGAGGLGGYH